jgi:hypothetical protein
MMTPIAATRRPLLTKSLFCSLLLAQSSCSILGRSESTPGHELSQRERSREQAKQEEQESSNETITAASIGAVTGAAIGGPIGAMVGGSSGAVLGGIAVGGVAGGATGVAVSRQIQENRAKMVKQQLELKRQEEILQLNRNRIKEMRGIQDDDLSNNQPSSRARLSGNSWITPFEGNLPSKLRSAPNLPPPIEDAPIVKNTPIDKAKVESAKVENKKLEKLKVSDDQEEQQTVVAEEEMPLITADDLDSKESSLEVQAAAKETTKEDEDKETELEPAVTKTEVSQQEEPSPQNTCDKGQAEFSRAQESQSDSDKLFYLRRAVRLCPTSGSYQLALSKLYLSLGRKKEAEQSLLKAIEVEPSNEEASQALKDLKQTKNKS